MVIFCPLLGFLGASSVPVTIPSTANNGGTNNGCGEFGSPSSPCTSPIGSLPHNPITGAFAQSGAGSHLQQQQQKQEQRLQGVGCHKQLTRIKYFLLVVLPALFIFEIIQHSHKDVEAIVIEWLKHDGENLCVLTGKNIYIVLI